jgi:uncharacterized UPF0160 family protein
LAGTEFMDRLDYYANSWLPARDLVIKALHERDDVDPSGKILLFEQFCPWKVCAILLSVSVIDAESNIGTSL